MSVNLYIMRKNDEMGELVIAAASTESEAVKIGINWGFDSSVERSKRGFIAIKCLGPTSRQEGICYL